jgi:hypothetical protein
VDVVGGEADLPHLPVEAGEPERFPVRPPLDHAPGIEDDDLVHLGDRARVVDHQDGRAAARREAHAAVTSTIRAACEVDVRAVGTVGDRRGQFP